MKNLPSLLMGALLAGLATVGHAHEINCDGRAGVDKARCERHQLMFNKCSPIKGEAHFACDREFLLANPLDCGKLQGADAKACQAELAASKTCEPQAGRAYMVCVRDTIKADPEGSPDKKK
jgi:hypothetical protein